MTHFFDIAIEHINLFSIMMGISFVVLTNLWGGRIFCTRIAFLYLAGLALYYGYIKHNIIDFSNPSETTFYRHSK